MDLNKYFPDLNRLEEDGAIILLKWDGAPTADKKTDVILRTGTDYSFRIDTDDLESAIKQGVANYDSQFS